MAWLNILWRIPIVIAAKLTGFVAILFVDRVSNPVWGNSWNYKSYWDSANPFGNAAHNLFRYPMPEFTTKSNTGDWTLEAREGFQWRYRKSLDGKYVSFRCTWGKPRKSKGKREWYFGWTLRDPTFEDGTMSLTLFQFRPF